MGGVSLPELSGKPVYVADGGVTVLESRPPAEAAVPKYPEAVGVIVGVHLDVVVHGLGGGCGLYNLLTSSHQLPPRVLDKSNKQKTCENMRAILLLLRLHLESECETALLF